MTYNWIPKCDLATSFGKYKKGVLYEGLTREQMLVLCPYTDIDKLDKMNILLYCIKCIYGQNPLYGHKNARCGAVPKGQYPDKKDFIAAGFNPDCEEYN